MPICDHIAFRVSDLERSISFYADLLPGRCLGIKEGKDFWRSRIAWIEPEGQEGFALVLIQATRIRWLLRLFHTFVPRATRSFEHMGFACPSREAVDDRAREADARGVKVLFGPEFVDEQVGYLFEVMDPDGNAVEWTFGKKFGPGAPS